MRNSESKVAGTTTGFLEALLEHSSDMIAVTDARGTLTWLSRAVERVLGFGNAEVIGRNILEFVHPDEVAGVADSMSTSVSEPDAADPLEIRVARADGSWLICEVVGVNRLKDPLVQGMVWHARDVSTRLELQRQHRRLFEDSPTPTFLGRPRALGVIANRAFAELIGYSVEELRTKSAQELLDASALPRLERFEAAMAEGLSVTLRGDIAMIRADGSSFQAEIAVTPVVDERGVMYITTVYDVTEWRDAVRGNANAQARFAAIADHSSDIIVLVERNGYWEANAATTRLLGYPKGFDPIEGPLHMIHMDDRGRAINALEDLFEGRWPEDKHFELRLIDIHGEVKEYEFRGRLNPAGDAVITARDLTLQRRATQQLLEQERRLAFEIAERERAEMETRLEQALRLESVGRLSVGLAHDFNNLVGVILNYTSVLERNDFLDGAGLQDVASISAAAEAAASLATSLLHFGEANANPSTVVDIRSVAQEIEPLVRASLRLGQSCALSLCESAALVQMDRGQLEQVFMNLAINARDAITDDGHIEIDVRLGSDSSGESVVMIDVSDDGVGMTDDVRKRAFDPFYTTKPTGLGTGLGLAVVHGIVKHHQGDVRLESTSGKGTRVSILIPSAIDQ